MTSMSSWWWLHVLCLVILQHVWVTAQELSPTNETYLGNITAWPDADKTTGTPSPTVQMYPSHNTTRPDQVYVTSEETSGTPNSTLETYGSNVTTEPDQVYTNSKETSGTPSSTLEIYKSNVTTEPDLHYITSEESLSTVLETFSSNAATGPDLYIFEDTSRTPNSTIYTNNVNTGPTMIREETSRIPNTTLESYSSTSGPPLTLINEETSGTSNTTVKPYLNNATTGTPLNSEETSGTANSTLASYSSTTGPHLTFLSEETSGISNTTVETYLNNATTGTPLISEETSGTANSTLASYSSTTGPQLTFLSEETSRTSNTTVETYLNNATTGPILLSKETPGMHNTPVDSYLSNVTLGSHSTFINDETFGPPYTTQDSYLNNVTSGPNLSYISDDSSRTPTSGSDLTYIREDTARTPNTTSETYLYNVTKGYISENTSGTPNSTLDSYSGNATSGSHLAYMTEETVGTRNTSLETFQNNVTIGTDLAYISEESTATPNTTSYTSVFHTGVTKPPDLVYTTSEEPAPEAPHTTLQTGGAPYISAVYCVQDEDCPPFTMCTGQGGLRVCQCHLGSYFHHYLGCITARTFLARIPSSVLYWDSISVNTTGHSSNEDDIRHMEAAQYHSDIFRVRVLFQNVFGHIPGYLSTSVTDVELDEGHVTIAHSFSTLYPVSEEDVWSALTVSPPPCAEPHPDCVSPLTSDNYKGLSLCDYDMCDSSSSACLIHGGLVTCECRPGFYKFSPMDRSCRECGSGFQWTENGCKRCPIGFGGFNCEESYLLVVIVESCVGCVLLVSLITLLVFYFRRKVPKNPTFIDSIVLGVPTDQPSLRLPRAQFSWRREWEWNEPPGKVLTDIHQEAASQEGPAIHMKTFGVPARFSAPNIDHGRHNLSFISD
ncbi:protein HEG-like isoform X2 [Bufo bufo]|uniref:protein HEG-like isoform X2 n=1 Tax=Bufo bufo TaxID=8384 RepID=UPI001ABE137A|nr:protein HEG-like isoform X2 [Bufo bufo]